MISINLIPEKLKKEIEFKKLFSFINHVIVILFILLFIYLSIFLLAKYILNKHYQETVNKFKLTSQDTTTHTNNMVEINKKIDFIYTLQENQVVWSKLIYDIGLTDNDGISIDVLSLNKDKKGLNIRGKAKSREKLLEFKAALEDISYLSDIIFPLQSLFKKEDISFDINANISSYDFRTK